MRAPRVPKLAVILIVVGVLLAVFCLKAYSNYRSQDPINSNFFSFWLSGHMTWTGESPYDSAQFLRGFDQYGATYRPSKILQYPLPLMYFLAPIGLLPVGAAYFAWQVMIEIIIAVAVYILLRHEPGVWVLFPLVTLSLLFFGPVYLSLQLGAVGALSLLALALAILLLQNKQPLWAGVALAITFLKPPQALTLMLLIGLWFLCRREWKAIAGVAIGGFALVAVWAWRDPLWLVKFRGSSDALLGRTLGVQSNVYSFAYLACNQGIACMWGLGTAAALVVLALGAFLLWRNRARWSDWDAFSIIIPLSFVSAVYLWSYDQLLYVIPITWIAARLTARYRSYLPVIAFLIVLDVVSFVALGIQAHTQNDLLSLLTTLLVLGLCLWLQRGHAAAEMQGSAAAPA
jgi:hypothetical protein